MCLKRSVGIIVKEKRWYWIGISRLLHLLPQEAFRIKAANRTNLIRDKEALKVDL